jgi:hypothetical protein
VPPGALHGVAPPPLGPARCLNSECEMGRASRLQHLFPVLAHASACWCRLLLGLLVHLRWCVVVRASALVCDGVFVRAGACSRMFVHWCVACWCMLLPARWHARLGSRVRVRAGACWCVLMRRRKGRHAHSTRCEKGGLTGGGPCAGACWRTSVHTGVRWSVLARAGVCLCMFVHALRAGACEWMLVHGVDCVLVFAC